MQFTQHETKLIKRLRKEDRRWTYLRWVMLTIGVLSIVACTGWGYILYKLVREGKGVQLDSSDAFIIAMLWTKCCMWLAIGAWSIATACAKWHGDANRLLLRLLDAQQEHTAAHDRVV